jgi:hypothetical protein
VEESNHNPDSQLSDYHVKRKLKPSGVVITMHIDPDASSDEEKSVSRMEKSAMMKKIEGKLEGSAMDRMDKDEIAKIKV